MPPAGAEDRACWRDGAPRHTSFQTSWARRGGRVREEARRAARERALRLRRDGASADGSPDREAAAVSPALPVLRAGRKAHRWDGVPFRPPRDGKWAARALRCPGAAARSGVRDAERFSAPRVFVRARAPVFSPPPARDGGRLRQLPAAGPQRGLGAVSESPWTAPQSGNFS